MVHQTPADIQCLPNRTVSINCSHKIQTYNTILWYQHTHDGTSLDLIGFVYFDKTKTFEKTEYYEIFSMTGDGRTQASLHISQTRQVEDSATYFCAASYTL